MNNTDLCDVIFPLSCDQANFTSRTANDYWNHPLLSKRYRDDSGQNLFPSQFQNIYSQNILYKRSRICLLREQTELKSRIFHTDDYWTSLIYNGVSETKATYSLKTEEHPGMCCIKNMMTCVDQLTKINHMKLEPFQLRCIRAGICSSGQRLLGDDLHLYIGKILQSVGLVHNTLTSYDPSNCSETLLKDMVKTFRLYSKNIISVVAPRRNGKSKAAKLFVAANAASEKGARIVLMAHILDAIMLYKSEILMYLEQIQNKNLWTYKIQSSSNEIRLDFGDGSSSFIFFVSGGINVSI